LYMSLNPCRHSIMFGTVIVPFHMNGGDISRHYLSLFQGGSPTSCIFLLMKLILYGMTSVSIVQTMTILFCNTSISLSSMFFPTPFIFVWFCQLLRCQPFVPRHSHEMSHDQSSFRPFPNLYVFFSILCNVSA